MEKQEVSEASTDGRHTNGTGSTLNFNTTVVVNNRIHRNNFRHATTVAKKVDANKEEA